MGEESKGDIKIETIVPVLENEKVRVLKINTKPGEKTNMHSHPEHLVCVLSDQKLKSTTSDGEENEYDLALGDVFYFNSLTHEVENIGKTDGLILIIELK